MQVTTSATVMGSSPVAAKTFGSSSKAGPISWLYMRMNEPKKPIVWPPSASCTRCMLSSEARAGRHGVCGRDDASSSKGARMAGWRAPRSRETKSLQFDRASKLVLQFAEMFTISRPPHYGL